MKDEIKSYKSVHLPHIRTHVHFMDMSKLKGMKIEGSAYTTVFEMSPHQINIGVFFEDIELLIKVPENAPTIAHELTHVLQYICGETGIDFAEEKEHGAYIISYLFEELLGLKSEERND